jgi:hypothetical protein
VADARGALIGPWRTPSPWREMAALGAFFLPLAGIQFRGIWCRPRRSDEHDPLAQRLLNPR